MKRMLLLAVLCISPSSFAQAATVVDVAAAKSPAFASILETSGLAGLLKGPGPFTLFVPTDKAFSELGGGWDKLKQDPERLKAVVAYHIVPGKVTSAELKQLISAKTMNGKALKVSVEGATIEVGKAKLLQADLAASNGLVHSIDEVLMP